MAAAVLADALAEWGEKPFRVRQIEEWKYRKLAGGWDEMRNVPQALRDRLVDEVPFTPLKLVTDLWSIDRQTTKVLFELPDGQTIEAVLMRQQGPHETSPRNTVCVSSQAGCKMACSFCATGHGGWRRNLTADEIAEQILYMGRVLRPEGGHVTNVVFMGMGEPLDNYDNVLGAIRLMNGPIGLGARNITVSTCGLVPQIERLAGESIQVNLAISLAATTDERRDKLIPANRRWPIAELLAAADGYASRTHRRVTFEYVLIAGVNDTLEEAERLTGLMTGRLAHVNLIPLNPVAGDAYSRPDELAVRRFEDVLQKAHVPISVRYSKGTDIVAGCGQLRAREAS